MTKDKFEIMKNMIKRGCTTKEISADLNISEPSARLYKRKIEEGQEALILPKSKTNIIREEISQNIVSIISENNAISLHGIQSTLEERGIQRSTSSICRTLKEKNFTRKRLRKIPNERNSEANLNTRQNFCRMINDIPDESLIFIDETGINLHLNQHYGYAPTGMTPTINEPANRGQNISCLVAISVHGVVSFCIDDGAINGNTFVAFIEAQIFQTIQRTNVIVMDNTRIHKVREIQALFTRYNIRLEYLPPYSPKLNPIEEYFSRFKSIIRRRRCEIINRQQLKAAAAEILDGDRNYSMSGYFRHMRRFTEIGFRREHF